MNPPRFNGDPNSWKAEKWLEAMNKVFEDMRIPDEEKIRCAVFKLEGPADQWWQGLQESWERDHTPQTWDNFTRKFEDYFVTMVTRDKIEVDFLRLEQGSMTVVQYSARFMELAWHCTHLVPHELRRVYPFVKGLRPELRKQLSTYAFADYQTTLDRAFQIENDLEKHQGGLKRGGSKLKYQEQGSRLIRGQPSSSVSGNVRGVQIIASTAQPVSGQHFSMVCKFCQRIGHTEEMCWKKQGKCMKCGEMGHIRKKCPKWRFQQGQTSSSGQQKGSGYGW